MFYSHIFRVFSIRAEIGDISWISEPLAFYVQFPWIFLSTVSKVAINIFAEGILVAVWSQASFVVTGRSLSLSNTRSSSPNVSLRAGRHNPYLKNGKDRCMIFRSDPSSIVCGFLGGTIARSVYISANSCRTKASFYSLNTPNKCVWRYQRHIVIRQALRLTFKSKWVGETF